LTSIVGGFKSLKVVSAVNANSRKTVVSAHPLQPEIVVLIVL
jgi:hypothetical protein